MVVDNVPAMALAAGFFSTICFTVQYIPQAWLNYKRKSISGLSTTGILIKLIGASFLGINAAITGETFPVVLYGLFNIAQHMLFMIQFTLFTNKNIYLVYCLVPALPYIFATWFPGSIAYTNLIKPLSQIMSHVPQLWVTYQKGSTEGVSLASQHFNMLGGFAGMYMYSLIPPKSVWTYVVYVNSLFQAISIYWMAVHYDGWERLMGSFDIFSYFRTINARSILSISPIDNTLSTSPKDDEKKNENDDLKEKV